MREEYLSYVEEYKDRLEPLMSKLIDESIWKRQHRLQVPNYSFNKTRLVYIFTKN